MHTLAPVQLKRFPSPREKKMIRSRVMEGGAEMSLARVASVRGVRRLFDIIILAARTRLPGISRKNGSLGLTAILFHHFFRVL